MYELDNLLYALYSKLRFDYGKEYPHCRGYQSGADYVSVHQRYLGRLKMIGILEQAEGREIEFVCINPEKEEEIWSSDDFTYRYLGKITAPDVKEVPKRNLLRKYYEVANIYTKKYDGPDENPVWFRDILGIEKTIELLKEALQQNKMIDFIWDEENVTIKYKLVSWDEFDEI